MINLVYDRLYVLITLTKSDDTEFTSRQRELIQSVEEVRSTALSDEDNSMKRIQVGMGIGGKHDRCGESTFFIVSEPHRLLNRINAVQTQISTALGTKINFSTNENSVNEEPQFKYPAKER